MARSQRTGVKRVVEKLYVEGEELCDLNAEEKGFLWRKPVGLFRQVADELRRGCIYRCMDIWTDCYGQYMVSLKSSETSLIHRCFEMFIFKGPFMNIDGSVVIVIKYDCSREKEEFLETYGETSKDIIPLDSLYKISFDVRVGVMGLCVGSIRIMVKRKEKKIDDDGEEEIL